MDVQTAIEKRRSVRRFLPNPVSTQTLYRLVELSRLYASAANLQPIRYLIVNEPQSCAFLFSQLKWAACLPDFEVAPETQPPAYILLLRDDSVSHSCRFEVGAAATNLMLSAVEMELGSCCLASFSAELLQKQFHLDRRLYPELVIAIGHTDQRNRILPFTDTLHYQQDAQHNFLVPKLETDAVLISYE